MTRGWGRLTVALVLLTFVVGYAAATQGGDEPFDSSLALFVLGLAAIAAPFFFLSPAPDAGSSADRIVIVAALLFPAYIAFQLVPLPLAVLKFVSPARAEVAEALGGIVTAPRYSPLTISPSSTSLHLARVTGCVLIFLLVRQLARQSVWIRWAASAPLIGVATIEAAWALSQTVTGAEQIVGSYYNRNHLAGLLEMVMPFAALYGITVLLHSSRRGVLTASDAVKACGGLGIALALLLAILFSLSKGGTFAAIGSLVVMGLLAIEGRASGWRRWALASGLVLGCTFMFVFLTPASLVERFSVFASDDVSEGRLPIWKDTLHLIRAYPLFGIGIGTFYPGLLRYQTAGLEFAWTAAHNDYLQSLSELGIVGFVFPAVAVGGSFVMAVRAAIAGRTRDARYFGLACTGGLVAFLIHSFSDFNAYVLSNAMVVAWIAGLSVAVSESPADNGSAATPPTTIPSAVRGCVAGAALLLTAYTGAWLIFFLYGFQSEPRAERVFCRFGVCDTEGELAALQGPHRDIEPAPVPVEDLVEYLRRDPASPSRWQDLGLALQKLGRIDAARYCVFRALSLAPNSPARLLAAASFQFDQGNRREALELVSRSLRAGEALDEAVFAALDEKRVPVVDIITYGLPDRRSAQAYLRRLLKRDRFDDVEQMWESMVGRGDAGDKLANEYTEFCFRMKQPEAAARGWALYARTKIPEYPDSNRMFNGDFGFDPSGNRFDWRIDARSGMVIDFDDAVRSQGRRSLRIRFDGTQNPSEIGVEQTVFLPAGRYRLQAHVKTQEITTDQGIAFRVVVEGGPPVVDVTTDNLRGSNEWTVLERVFEVPSSSLARVSVVRKPSLKFDNLISGTAWIGRVTLVASKN